MSVFPYQAVYTSSTTTGTSDFQITGGKSSSPTYPPQLNAGDQFYYVARDRGTGQWESGIGTVNADNHTLQRTTILNGSNGPGVAVSWVGGTREISLSSSQPLIDAIGTSAIAQLKVSPAPYTNGLPVTIASARTPTDLTTFNLGLAEYTNLPNNTRPNEVMSIGWNVQSGGIVVSGEPGSRIGFEQAFAPDGTHLQMETHLSYFTGAGAEYRWLSTYFDRSSSFLGMSSAHDTLTLLDRSSGTNYVNFAKSAITVQLGTPVTFVDAFTVSGATTMNGQLTVQPSTTITSGTFNSTNFQQTINPGAASSASYAGCYIQPNVSGAQNLTGTVYGTQCLVFDNNTGTKSSLLGCSYSVIVNNTTVASTFVQATSVTGGTFSVSHQGSGHITVAYGGSFSVNCLAGGGTGKIDNGVGCLIQAPGGTGPVTNSTGIEIQNQGRSGVNAGVALQIDAQSGAAAQNRAIWVRGGEVILADGALATTATAGFTWLPRMHGAPTGTPSDSPTAAPCVLDDLNNKVWFYLNGAWKGVVVA